MVKSFERSVRPDSVGVEFDDERLIANAGLVLIAILGRRLGIAQMVDKMVRLGERAGAAGPGRKVLTLIHAIAAGAVFRAVCAMRSRTVGIDSGLCSFCLPGFGMKTRRAASGR